MSVGVLECLGVEVIVKDIVFGLFLILVPERSRRPVSHSGA
jgi:hypothetical protein